MTKPATQTLQVIVILLFLLFTLRSATAVPTKLAPQSPRVNRRGKNTQIVRFLYLRYAAQVNEILKELGCPYLRRDRLGKLPSRIWQLG